LSVYYLDTSALVKLYVREPGTERMLRLADPAGGHTLAVLGLARVEFHAAIRLRERLGDVTHEIAGQVLGAMEERGAKLLFNSTLPDLVIEEAVALVGRHALKAYDAVQLAGHILLRARLGRPATFVCSDRQLLKAAADEGMSVLDPTSETGGL
jgi:predicted nucleic acid-binding protein